MRLHIFTLARGVPVLLCGSSWKHVFGVDAARSSTSMGCILIRLNVHVVMQLLQFDEPGALWRTAPIRVEQTYGIQTRLITRTNLRGSNRG